MESRQLCVEVQWWSCHTFTTVQTQTSKHFTIHRSACTYTYLQSYTTSSRHVHLVALGATVLPFCLFRRPVPPEPLPGTPLKPHTWHRARSPLRVRASRRHAGTRARARASKWCRWGARRLGDPGPGPHGQRQVVRACALTATRAGTSPSRGLFTRSARAGPWPLLAVSSGYWPTRQLAEYSQ